ncbi:MAG: polysaccharide deacetylase family protein [Oscillospiraceae bacterium]|nr:polysaccharide deacetylase family protein [Oscillospiraceae bacterium]
MTAKRWVIMFCIVSIILASIVPMMNIIIDPFSVFGDRLYEWNSHGMTNNPKAAKFAYVDARRGEFDAFIIGPSGASVFSPDKLEEYTGLRWYNMFNYGSDMEYMGKLAKYLIENHMPKHILLVLPAVSAVSYAPAIWGVTNEQPMKPFWRTPFLFANPQYAVNKAKAYPPPYVQGGWDVFVARTGTYNKTRRAIEPIGAMEDYLIAYPEFVAPRFWNQGMIYIEESTLVVAEIAQMCSEQGIELTIVAPPMLAEEISSYNVEKVQDFYSGITDIADINGLWYFITSSVSYEPRYFYDTTHARTAIGNIMIAKMFGDDSLYIPDDFGIWMTSENVDLVIEAGFGEAAIMQKLSTEEYTAELPVLMYHHLTDNVGTYSAISISGFVEHMEALVEAGFTAVSLEQVMDYVYRGIDLPEKPILITFDDGYESNYTVAFPILREFGFHGTIFAIGVTYDKKDLYKDTERQIIPHFGHKEAREMVNSGLISIQSHSYDMHNVEEDDDPFRDGVLQFSYESDDEYLDMFRKDHALMEALLQEYGSIVAFAYPYGRISTISAVLLNELGVKLTFSVDPGINTIIKGLPQSLFALKRFNMDDDVSPEDLLEMIGG